MKQLGKIRVKVFGLIRDKERLFVSEDYDSVKQEKYYRANGIVLNLLKLAKQPYKESFKKKFKRN